MSNSFRRGFKSWCETVSVQQRKLLDLQTTDPLDPWLLAKHHEILVWNANEVPGLDPRYLRVLTKGNLI